MKIIDLVKEKPIELVACIQYNKTELADGSKEFYFYTSNYRRSLDYTTEIKRVGTIELEGEKYDVIFTLFHNNKTRLFLGRWNSGKVNIADISHAENKEKT